MPCDHRVTGDELNHPMLDVLMCVGCADVGYLFPYALLSLAKHFPSLGRFYIATDAPDAVTDRFSSLSLFKNPTIVADDDFLSHQERLLPGWYRQQIIKLRAYELCETSYFCCLGADTILLRTISRDALVDDRGAILYYNRYPEPSSHLEYERKRVASLSMMLNVPPKRSFILGDFIMDLMTFDRQVLRSLHRYLETLYGHAPFVTLLCDRQCRPQDRVLFGEWTMYAIFVLDVQGLSVSIRNAHSKFLRQVHNERVLRDFKLDADVVHFVDKNFDVSYIVNQLRACGIEVEPREPTQSPSTDAIAPSRPQGCWCEAEVDSTC